MNKYLTSTQEKYTQEKYHRIFQLQSCRMLHQYLCHHAELQVNIVELLIHLLKAEIARLLVSFPGLCKRRYGAGRPVRS